MKLTERLEYIARTSAADGDEEEATALKQAAAALDAAERALDGWSRYADEVLREFGFEPCDSEALCPKCRPAGCINLKIRETAEALALLRKKQP